MKTYGINPVICLLISACLLFVIYNSTAVLLLSLFGTSTGTHERIMYLTILPAINKPAHLVDFRTLSVGGLFFHILSIPDSLFLLLLASGRFGTRVRKK